MSTIGRRILYCYGTPIPSCHIDEDVIFIFQVEGILYTNRCHDVSDDRLFKSLSINFKLQSWGDKQEDGQVEGNGELKREGYEEGAGKGEGKSEGQKQVLCFQQTGF